MLVEALVFRRYEGIDQFLRNRVERQEKAALAGIFGEQRAIARVNPAS